MLDKRCFVQFMHPGDEHKPDEDDIKRWNQGPHKRKFLKSLGRSVADSVVLESEIVHDSPPVTVTARISQRSPSAAGMRRLEARIWHTSHRASSKAAASRTPRR